MSKYKDYIIYGTKSPNATVNECVILDSFSSTGNGQRQLEECKRSNFRDFTYIRLAKIVA